MRPSSRKVPPRRSFESPERKLQPGGIWPSSSEPGCRRTSPPPGRARPHHPASALGRAVSGRPAAPAASGAGRTSGPAFRQRGREAGACAPGAAGVRTDAARHARKPAPSGRHAVLLSTFSVGRGDVTASLRLCSFEARAEQTARGRCSLTPRSPWNLSPHWSLDKLQGSSESSPKAGDGGERAAERSLRPWQSPCSGARPSSPSPSAGRAP